jgi:hypothetical protein
MKASWTFIFLIGTIAILHSFKLQKKGVLKGKIEPSSKVKTLWALDEDHKTQVSVHEGAFELELRPGNYKLYIDAAEPLKDGMYRQIQVREEDTTDLGLLILH